MIVLIYSKGIVVEFHFTHIDDIAFPVYQHIDLSASFLIISSDSNANPRHVTIFEDVKIIHPNVYIRFILVLHKSQIEITA